MTTGTMPTRTTRPLLASTATRTHTKRKLTNTRTPKTCTTGTSIEAALARQYGKATVADHHPELTVQFSS
jgi:hypothetical protein